MSTKDAFDCRHPDCDELADTDEGYCYFHAKDSAPAAPQLALAPEPEGIAMLCKIAGCGKPRADRAGIYASLCLEHKQAKREKRQAGKKAAGRAFMKPVSNGSAPLSLVELAQRVEAAQTAYRQAVAALQGAIDTYA